MLQVFQNYEAFHFFDSAAQSVSYKKHVYEKNTVVSTFLS
jgi:hypothetical protein